MSRPIRTTVALLGALVLVLLAFFIRRSDGVRDVASSIPAVEPKSSPELPRQAPVPATPSALATEESSAESRQTITRTASGSADVENRLYGIVRSTSGEPLASAFVRTDASRWAAMSQPDGSFSVALPPGVSRCSITVARDADYLPTTKSDIDVAATAGAPIVVVLRSRALHVHVAAAAALESNVIQGLRAFGDHALRSEPPPAFYTGGAQVLRVRRLPPKASCPNAQCLGSLDLSKPEPIFVHVLWGSQMVGTAKTTGSEAEIEVPVEFETIRARSGSATVHVRNGETGVPIVGAWVSMVDRNERATTSASGEARLDALPFGAMSLWVRASGFADATRHLDLQRPQEVVPTIDLFPKAKLTGVVRDATTAQPVACKVEIQQFPERRNAGWVTWFTEQVVGDDGVFSYNDLNRGEYIVRARSERLGAACEVVDLRAGSSKCEISLDTGSRVEVTCAPHVLKSAWMLTIDSAKTERTVWTAWAEEARKNSPTLAKGRYVCRALDQLGRSCAEKAFDVGAVPMAVTLD